MTLPRAHRGFFVFSLLATALALGIAALAPPGGRLLLGGVAAVLVLVAGLRGARRSALGRRLGSAAGQLRAHLWLGGLSLVFALAHGGGRLGGPLSTALVLTLAESTEYGGRGEFGLVVSAKLPRTRLSLYPFVEVGTEVLCQARSAGKASSASLLRSPTRWRRALRSPAWRPRPHRPPTGHKIESSRLRQMKAAIRRCILMVKPQSCS